MPYSKARLYPCGVARVAMVVLVLSFLNTISAGDELGQTTGQSYFESDARLIFKTHCLQCHGEETEVAGKLDLRMVRLMMLGGESGPAIQAGSAANSLIWQRIESGEMPPKGKGLTSAEKDALYRWLDEGAKTKRPEPEQISDLNEWTEEELTYWAFQPLRRPAVPVLSAASAPANAIDSFLLAELGKHGLGFSPQADRITLVRRLSFDLLGLPPTHAMIEQFMADESPAAYEDLVDRLMASPAYGERWGRHWLDAAGYADSDGYTENDTIRPWAYRYRDYVIRAFNSDMPLDQFVIEQMAGDELLTPPYENLTPEQGEKLAATGFLRMAPDGTGESGVDANVARNDVVAETIKIVSTSLLGMTVGCAQCHNHRYDPISQKDYYRFRAVFEPALDYKNWKEKPSRLVSLWGPEERQQAALVDAEVAAIESHRNEELDCVIHQVFNRELEKLPAERQSLGKLARETPDDKRTEEQRAILKEFPSLNIDRGSAYLYEPGTIDQLNKRHESLAAEARSKRPPENFVACLTETPGNVPATFVFFRGDINQPRETVEPGDLSILASRPALSGKDTNLPTSGRRLGLAKYWTSGQNPLLPRALVNRIWAHHFGRGIVGTPGDFGRLGEAPSHPELLDWLASELVHSGWQMKRLQRLIVTSEAYRQQSAKSEQLQTIDPENRLYGRMSIRRLEAEAIRDALIEMTGQSANHFYGPAVPINPDDAGQAIIGPATRDGNGILVAQFQDGPDQYRRSIYLQVRRSLPFGMLEPFDLPNLAPNCDRRNSSTVAPQSLLMMNNRYTILYAEKFADRVQRQAGQDVANQIKLAWKLAFGVAPSDAELAASLDLLATQRAAFEAQSASPPPTDAAAIAARGTALPSEAQALAIFCQALISSNRFLYVG
jgi:mono/diheme cytochrome c family protein